MTVDMNVQILDAFQAEHKEQLEGIRGLLEKLENQDTAVNSECVDEAFRLAHSLKGGARVCDLRPPESLAHGLENLFEQVRERRLCLDSNVVNTINLVLDTIEDWMAALERHEQPGEVEHALAAVAGLLDARCDGNGEKAGQGDADNAGGRLAETFRPECAAYLTNLRQFLASCKDGNMGVASDDVGEAYRVAHQLRSSAEAAEFDSIARTGKKLERCIAAFAAEPTTPDSAEAARLWRYVEAIDGELSSLATRREADAGGHSREDDGSNVSAAGNVEAAGDLSSETAKAAAESRHAKTVRISTESLDRLWRNSRQLVMETVRQDGVVRQLKAIRQQVSQLQRERESIRREAPASWHRLAALPEFSRLAEYLETVDRGVEALARDARRLSALQKRNTWLLRSHGCQIQRDVRNARMVPAEAVYQGFRKLARDLAKADGKEVEFRVVGFDVRADRMVFQALKDSLIHMLRNAVVHGLESPNERAAAGKHRTGRVELRIEASGHRLVVEVDDDGRGIDRQRVAGRAIERGLASRADVEGCPPVEIDDFIFQPGLSTSRRITEVAGRGMGLSVVRKDVARLQGEARVVAKESPGTTFRISVPLSVSTLRLLVVVADDQKYAIPMRSIERLLRLNVAEVEYIEGQAVVTHRDLPIPLVTLAGALRPGAGSPRAEGETLQVAILKSGSRPVAVAVDAFLEERDLLIQDIDGFAANDAYLGAVLLDDGEVALVLNSTELLARARPAQGKFTVDRQPARAEGNAPRVLVVDDSVTTRTMEKSILEANGYKVGIAVDGVEGIHQLRKNQYDLVISDVEMPRMDGFGLLAAMKKDERLASTPVILVTSRARREDQEKGLDLGAEAYIVKRNFDHESLLSTIRQVVDV